MVNPPKQRLAQVERERLASFKTRFDAARDDFLSALQRRDFDAAEKALRVQRDILTEQRELLLFRIERAKSQ